MNRAAIAGLTVLLPIAACKAEPNKPIQRIELTYDRVCGAKIDGQLLPPIDGASFDAELQKMLPDKDTNFSFGQPTVPRACVELMHRTLGRLGYRGMIGFISEPPSGMIVPKDK
jgi:hypothetical protein